MGWQFQYWNGSAWVNFANAQIDHILEELSSVGGQEELVFNLPNTAANRAIVQSLPFVQCLFNGALIFPLCNMGAVIGELQYSPTLIQVTAYNAVFVKMSQASQTITQVYNDTAANTILSAICSAAGVSAGACPTFAVSITFNNANCFKAAQSLAQACGMDYWADANGFNIGTRDSTLQTLGYCDDNSKRGLDYSKTVDYVVVNGVNSSGLAIQGSAGTPGGSIATFTEKKACDVATLNNVAAFKLQKLNNPSDGNSLECLITQVATWHPGQYVSASRADLDLVGSYIIQRITKNVVTCTVEVDAAMPQMDVDALEQDDYSGPGGDLSSYPAQPSTQTPTALVLQGLIGFYHLWEGQGTFAQDSAPNTAPNNGNITNGTWIAGPLSDVLQFSGTGNVDCTNNADVTEGGTNSKFAVGGWFSPSALVDQAPLISKANQFILELSGTAGAIRFGVYIGGTWHYLTSPNGVISVNGRCFAMGVYDGANLYLYVSNPSGVSQLLTYTQAQTGSIASSTAELYLAGSTYQGVIAECMIWSRALGAQEVQELFFRPLVRVINISQVGLYLEYGSSVKPQYVVAPTYLLDSLILSGKVVVSSATGTMNSYEAGYTIVSLLQFGGSTYYSLCQAILDLWASLQNSDGSWYQQYNPYSPYGVVAQTSEGTDGNLKVDSGAALLAWAMSYYDQLTSGTRYKSNVQSALSFLRQLQYAHTVAHSSNLIANVILDGTTDTTALLADCAECLLSTKHAMDAYGVALQTSAGYSVQTFANNLYYSICVVGWRGSSALYFDTSYPYGQNTNVPFNYQEKISYTQALCSWAVYEFAKSAYQNTGDFSGGICEPCLDFIITVTRGSWGGEYYCPYTAASGQTQDEFAGYSALMCIAAQKVNSAKYASLISGLQSFLKWLALPDGRVCDDIDVTGRLWRSQISSGSTITEGGFLVLPIAMALLAGAGS
jgi:hypothetical protein